MNDLLDFDTFNPLGRDDLDQIYLGTKISVPLWELLILAPPGISMMQGLVQTSFSTDSMKQSANYGMILKIGDHCFEEVKNKDGSRAECPYKTGEWISFEEFHPQSRKVNGVMVYYIADSRIMGRHDELDTWDCYLLFEDKLKRIREHASSWLHSSRAERLRLAGSDITYD